MHGSTTSSVEIRAVIPHCRGSERKLWLKLVVLGGRPPVLIHGIIAMQEGKRSMSEI